MFNSLAPVLALAFATVFALAACGGDDAAELSIPEQICAETQGDFDNIAAIPMSPDLAATACDGVPLTEEQFVTQANAVCSEADARLAALVAGEPETLDDYADYGLIVARIDLERAVNFRALISLNPPQSYAEGASRAVALRTQMSELAREASEAAAAGDEAQLEQFQAEYDAVGAELNAVWEDLGLDDCVV